MLVRVLLRSGLSTPVPEAHRRCTWDELWRNRVGDNSFKREKQVGEVVVDFLKKVSIAVLVVVVGLLVVAAVVMVIAAVMCGACWERLGSGNIGPLMRLPSRPPLAAWQWSTGVPCSFINCRGPAYDRKEPRR